MRFLRAAVTILVTIAVGTNKVSAYAEGTCPDYREVTDWASIKDFSYEKYQGVWYHTATTEPTEPTFCKCDRLTWFLNPDGGKTFTNILQTQCAIPGLPFVVPLTFPQDGVTSQNPAEPTNQKEGATALGFPQGRQYIVYVDIEKHKKDKDDKDDKDKDITYENAIVFSCGINYTTYPNGPSAPPVVYPYFNSLQFLTRSSNPTQETLDRLIKKAKTLGIRFNVADIDYKLRDQNCVFPPPIGSLGQVAAAATSNNTAITTRYTSNSASYTAAASTPLLIGAAALLSQLL